MTSIIIELSNGIRYELPLTGNSIIAFNAEGIPSLTIGYDGGIVSL